MTSIVWTLIAAAVVTGVAVLAADASGARRLASFGEPVALALLVAAATVDHRPGQSRAWLIAGLAVATAATACGAFARLRSSTGARRAELPGRGRPKAHRAPEPVDRAIGFQLGFSMIALTLLAVAMQRHRTDNIGVVFGLVLVLLAVFAFGYRVIAGAEAAGGAPLAIAVAAYLAALGSMVVLGVGTASLLIGYASLGLAVSHLTFARHHLVVRRAWAPAAVAASSQGALIAMLIGLLR